MIELTFEELGAVSGGMTENECVGVFTVGGAGLGGMIGGFAGAGLGGMLGGATGLMLCNSIVNPSSGSPRGDKP